MISMSRLKRSSAEVALLLGNYIIVREDPVQCFQNVSRIFRTALSLTGTLGGAVCCQNAGSYAEVAPSEAIIAEHGSIGMSLQSVFLLGGGALISARLSRHLEI